MRIGLTGGMGMGKTAAGEILHRRGLPVADSDVIAREVVEPGQPALADIAARFGAEGIGPDGRLRRDWLAGRVFSDAGQRQALERILHPRICQVWQDRLEAWHRAGQERGVVVVPLLYEVGLVADFDRVICVACTAATQQERLRARGWSEEQIRRRQEAQWPADRKIAQADFVAWSEGSLDLLAVQLDRILGCL